MKLSFKGGFSRFKRAGTLHVGVDLSLSRPVVLGLKPGADKTAAIVHAGQWAVPDSAFIGGDVTDALELARSLRDYLQQHQLGALRICLALAPSKAYVEKIVVDQTNDAMLALQAEDHLQTALNCDVGDFSFDYQPIQEYTVEPGTCGLAVAAVRADVIDGLTDAFASCGLPLTSIEIESFAHVDGALQLTRQKESPSLCLVQCDNNRVRLIRVTNGMVVSDNALAISGSAWIDAARWTLDQLCSVAYVSTATATPSLEGLSVLLTGESAQRSDWAQVVERCFNARVKSIYQHTPPQVQPAMWGKICAAYAVAHGGQW